MNSPTLILGVDPGLRGALALYDPLADGELFDQVAGVWDMPLRQSKTHKSILDLPTLALLIKEHAHLIKYAVIEQVSASPGAGVVSMFRFGESLGVVTGMVAAHFIPIIMARPSSWKLAMGLGRDKDESRERVTRLFPSEAHRFSRKKDDGRAEALLLAVFGSRHLD